MGRQNELKKVIISYAKKADVLKISDDEVTFVTGEKDMDVGAKKFFEGNVKVLAVTRGSHGAKLFTSDGKTCENKGYKVNAVDTTGAGDSFFGGFLSELINNSVDAENLLDIDYQSILDFACKCGSYTTTGYGAIAAMGTRKDIIKIGE